MPRIEIPKLLALSLRLLPEEKSLGIQIRQGPDDASEIVGISPGGPASRVPLKVGYHILCVNGHRARSADKCAQLFQYYTKKKSTIDVLVSAGTLPPGAMYVLVKAGAEEPFQNFLEDGSLQGLFLKEENGAVRIKDIGPTGIFSHAKINRMDILLAIDGREVHTINDCERALNMVSRDISRDIVPILTYNVFRKARSTMVVSTLSKSSEKLTQSPNQLRRASMSELYEIGTELGSGGFSTVVLCRSRITGDRYAMKIVNRASLSIGLEVALKHEVAILNDLDHPNILRLVETFSTIKTHYLVTELLEGGELFDRIVEKTTYTESEARDVSKILLRTLEYCHQKKYAHRDLKPENILLKTKDDDTQIKIADFGLARAAPEEDSLKTMCGSPYYISPEILKRHRYGTKTDIWSVGVIIFILLGGYPPFADEDRDHLNEMIKNCKYTFKDEYWGSVSARAKAFIKSLLVVNPRDRLSAQDALKHPWMKTRSELLRKNSLHGSQQSIEAYFVKTKFQDAVKKIMAVNVIRSSLSLRSTHLDTLSDECMDGKTYTESPVLQSVFSEKNMQKNEALKRI